MTETPSQLMIPVSPVNVDRLDLLVSSVSVKSNQDAKLYEGRESVVQSINVVSINVSDYHSTFY